MAGRSVLGVVVMGFASLLLSLLVMSHPTEQQYAWRPQGRFGKRTSELFGTNALLGALSRDPSQLSESVRLLTDPVFETDGVVCLSTGSKGLYRCFSLDSADLQEQALTKD